MKFQSCKNVTLREIENIIYTLLIREEMRRFSRVLYRLGVSLVCLIIGKDNNINSNLLLEIPKIKVGSTSLSLGMKELSLLSVFYTFCYQKFCNR